MKGALASLQNHCNNGSRMTCRYIINGILSTVKRRYALFVLNELCTRFCPTACVTRLCVCVCYWIQLRQVFTRIPAGKIVRKYVYVDELLMFSKTPKFTARSKCGFGDILREINADGAFNEKAAFRGSKFFLSQWSLQNCWVSDTLLILKRK